MAKTISVSALLFIASVRVAFSADLGDLPNGCYSVDDKAVHKVHEVGSILTQGTVNTNATKLREGPIVMGSQDGRIYLFNLDAKKEFEIPVIGKAGSSVAYLKGDNVAAVGTSEGYLYLVNSKGEINSKKIGEGEFSIAAMPNGKDLVIQTTKGEVYLARRGLQGIETEHLFSVKLGGVHTPPAIVEGRIVVGSQSGKVYAYDLDERECISSTSSGDGCEALFPTRSRTYV